MRRLKTTIIAVLFCVVGFSSHAQADMIRSGTKAMAVEISLGPTFALSGSGVAFDIHMNFGYHFSGDGSGLALGGGF